MNSDQMNRDGFSLRRALMRDLAGGGVGPNESNSPRQLAMAAAAAAAAAAAEEQKLRILHEQSRSAAAFLHHPSNYLQGHASMAQSASQSSSSILGSSLYDDSLLLENLRLAMHLSSAQQQQQQQQQHAHSLSSLSSLPQQHQQQQRGFLPYGPLSHHPGFPPPERVPWSQVMTPKRKRDDVVDRLPRHMNHSITPYEGDQQKPKATATPSRKRKSSSRHGSRNVTSKWPLPPLASHTNGINSPPPPFDINLSSYRRLWNQCQGSKAAFQRRMHSVHILNDTSITGRYSMKHRQR